MLLVLDSGPLWDLSHPKAEGKALDIQNWSRTRLPIGDQFVVPEIADYEVRRELLRANKETSLKQLDDLCDNNLYLQLTTAVMQEAAALWAYARKEGLPTAHKKALDGDVILVVCR